MSMRGHWRDPRKLQPRRPSSVHGVTTPTTLSALFRAAGNPYRSMILFLEATRPRFLLYHL